MCVSVFVCCVVRLVGLSKLPFQLVQVPLPWQHAVSRNECKLLSSAQKSLLVQRPVRVMLCAALPCGPDEVGRLQLTPDNVYFVAKDVAQLLHIHEANVAVASRRSCRTNEQGCMFCACSPTEPKPRSCCRFSASPE